ncbi:MAG: hypothetical protein LBU32_33380 [Clostridiales bacterium]|nr:hypothetical protein [Clostridiales bacterium]
MDAAFMGKRRHKNDMAAWSSESQSPQASARIPEGCGPSGAVSVLGESKTKKSQEIQAI